MQNVSFLIARQDQLRWLPVIKEIEKQGYEVGFESVESKTTVVLSGSYLNPFAVSGKKILVAHQQESGPMWDSIYKPVLEEYYDVIIDVSKVSIGDIMNKIWGEIGVTKQRNSNREL